MVEVTVNWFRFIQEKYGKDHPRLTEIRNFDSIEASKVVEANQKLYINREEGFIGTSLKKDEFICNCSDIDDIIIFYKDGTYKVIRIGEKVFIGETERSKNEKRKCQILHVAIFKKGDTRTIYNCVYRDGRDGAYFIKRFNVTSITRDREYDLTQGKPGSRVAYFTANPNGEAEIIKVSLKPNPKLKRVFFEKDFSQIMIKGRSSMGNLLTKLDVERIGLKSHGTSTLGGRKVWFDHDVKRLNYDERGQFLGEFHSNDSILVMLDDGEFYVTNFDLNNHYEQNILRIEKYDPTKVWTVALFDAEQGFPYLKRFTLEASTRHQNFLGEKTIAPTTAAEAAKAKASCILLFTDTVFPRLLVRFGAPDDFRDPMEIDAEQFIGQKSFKARGKRITTLAVAAIEELEPTRFPTPKDQDDSDNSGSSEDPDDFETPENPDGDETNDSFEEINPATTNSIDPLTGQFNLFE
jgi:topoisomerase-4 subunit A